MYATILSGLACVEVTTVTQWRVLLAADLLRVWSDEGFCLRQGRPVHKVVMKKAVRVNGNHYNRCGPPHLCWFDLHHLLSTDEQAIEKNEILIRNWARRHGFGLVMSRERIGILTNGGAHNPRDMARAIDSLNGVHGIRVAPVMTSANTHSVH